MADPTTSQAEPFVEEVIDESMDTEHVPPRAQYTPPPYSSSHGFSFEGIPTSKWRDKILEMNAWCTLEMLQPQAVLRNVLERCTAKFHGRLRDWYIRLGEYRQL